MPPPRKRKRKRIAEDQPPTKWTAPIFGIVRDKDGNIVQREGMPDFTDEQKRTFLENAEYFRNVRPKP